MQSQRPPLYARATCARMRGRACTRVYARVVRFLSSFPLSSASSLPFHCVLRTRPLRVGTRATRPRALAFLALAPCCSTCARGVRRTRKRRALSSHGGFAVCIAWRRRVMRAGVRIYGRHGCSRNADRWNVKVPPPFFFSREIRARQKKFNVYLAERDEHSFSYDGDKIGASEDPGVTFAILCGVNTLFVTSISKKRFARNKIRHRHAMKITTMSEKIWRRTKRGT